ncbi:unnamed protein product [Schistosoma curassoni]|uniref:Integral membrane protein n=1 Tax=Schistosoma curassoni TaxID=6186 RepID=A0A183K2N1_9TREM|nr:unnamed protein product [Schistosoma curassoni]
MLPLVCNQGSPTPLGGLSVSADPVKAPEFRIVLPAVHFIPGNDLNGSYENVIDAIYQIGNNYILLGNCIIYVFSIAIFNYCGLSIARSLSSIHRTLIDSLRTALVWICSLILYYGIGPPYGEPFNIGWGLIES